MILSPRHCSRRFDLETFNILTGEMEGFDWSNPKICHGGKGGGSGGGTNTVTSNSAPPPEVMAAYQTALNAAQSAASAPLQQYGGPTIAGFTPDQQSAFSNVNNAQGAANPYFGQAQTMIQNGTTPVQTGVQDFNQANINQYMSPYTQQVLNAQIGLEQNQDAQQQQGLMGNIISKGAWGGDRAGVAQSVLAGQQALANNSTNANILNQGYTQGVNQFNTQNQQTIGANEANNYLSQQGAFGMANLGQQTFQNALTGASAQLQTGGMQQQLGQAALNVPYQQFLQQQGYPFQTAQYYANIAEGIGSGSGGTGTSTSTNSGGGPSTASQIFGGITGVAGLALPFFLNRGGRVGGMARGGRIGYDDGGRIPDDIPNLSVSYVPVTSASKAGSGPPTPPTVQAPKQQTAGPNMSGLGDVGKLLNALTKSDPSSGLAGMTPGAQDIWSTGMANGNSFGDIAQMAASQGGIDNFLGGSGGGLSSLMSLWRARGGRVGGMAGGGRVGYSDGGGVLEKILGLLGGGLGGMAATSLMSRGGRMGYDGGGGVAATAAIDPNKNNDEWAAGLQKLQARFLPGVSGTSQTPGSTKQNAQPFADGGDVYNDGIHLGYPPPPETSGMAGIPGVPGLDAFAQDAFKSSGIPNAGISPVPMPPTSAMSALPGAQQKPLPNPTAPATAIADPTPQGGMGGPPPPPEVQVAEADTDPMATLGGMAKPAAAAEDVPFDQEVKEGLTRQGTAKADPYLSLAKAGFAMMGGQSPYAMENIGKGAVVGIEDYQNQRKQADTINRDVDKLVAEAKWHREQLAIQQQNADTMEGYRKDQAANTARAARAKELVKDSFGNPIGWADPVTQRIIPINGSVTGGMQRSPANVAAGDAAPKDGSMPAAPQKDISAAVKSLPPDAQERLANYPQNAQSTIMGLIQGRIPATRQYLGSNPQAFIAAAGDVEPGFDVATATARMKTAAGYAPEGSQGKIITALNTASRHAAATALAGIGLNNTSGYPYATTVNDYLNSYNTSSGDPRTTNYGSFLGNYGHEAIKVISGKTNPGEAETEEFTKPLKDSGSPEQILGALSAKNGMMLSRAEEMQKAYDDQMGPYGQKKQVVSPDAAQAFTDMDTLYHAAKLGKMDTPEVKAAQARLEVYARPAIEAQKGMAAHKVPPANQRAPGVYDTPKGKLMWDGSTWQQPAGAQQ